MSRITGEYRAFDTSMNVRDAYNGTSDHLYASIVPVFTSSDNVFTQYEVESEESGFAIKENATKKYLLTVNLTDRDVTEYIKIAAHRYKLAFTAVYAFESGAYSFEIFGMGMSGNFVKGWNLLWAELEPDEDGELAPVNFYFEPMTSSLYIDTKEDGLARCDDALQMAAFADLFVTELTVYANGLYTRTGSSWAYTGTVTEKDAKQALALAQAVSENETLGKLSENSGMLLYDGKPALTLMEELLPDNTDVFTQMESGATWTEGDTTQYYERSEWNDGSGRATYLPIESSFFSEGYDLSWAYTRSSRYDYRLQLNRAYSLLAPDVENADVYLHFPTVRGDVAGTVTLCMHIPVSVNVHWGRVCFDGSAPTLEAGHSYAVVARYNTALGMWALTVTEYSRYTDASAVPAEQKPLADCTWAEIAAISENGWYDESTCYWCTGDVSSPVSWFVVGDEKTITLTDDTQITVQIFGFQHDDVGMGAKAGITFGLKNAMAAGSVMNLSDLNKGGWKASYMRNETLAEIYNLLPQDMRDVLLTVRKKTTEGTYSRDVEVTYDKLFLFAYSELFGDTDRIYRQEGELYPIITNQQARVKNRGDDASASPCWWWLRSPNYSSRNSFWGVRSSGSSDSRGAYFVEGVVFGFCV